MASSSSDGRAADGISSDWETLGVALPHGKVEGARTSDFNRFSKLQRDLKAVCACMLQFTRREFGAVAGAEPELAEMCSKLMEPETRVKLCELESYALPMESLVQRIQDDEKLRIIFIGPLKAGKSTLINMLLSASLDAFEMLLPVDNKAATNCIWKVESCSGSKAQVFLNDLLQKEWSLDGLEPKDIRLDISDFLDLHFSREVNPLNRGTISVLLPLQLLDPFGCHYSLVDTPGFNESAEYKDLVSAFLQDHSHVACMVCPLTEGMANPKETQSMLKLNSYSKTFWVLTRFDMALTFRSKTSRLQPMGMSKRQAADSLVAKFEKDIAAAGQVAKGSRVFRHAGSLLQDPDEEFNQALQKHLPLCEAKAWIADIRAHVKECFMALQQEQTVLSSQAQQALARTADLNNEYTTRVNSIHGTVAAGDFYAGNMQEAAEKAADHLQHEITCEIDLLKGTTLGELCAEARQEVLAEGGRAGKVCWVRHRYIERVLTLLVPKIEGELERKLGQAMARAHQKMQDVAVQQLQQAGLTPVADASVSTQSEIFRPETGHLYGRYPVESMTMLTGATFLAGRLAAGEVGATVLSSMGLSFTSLQLLGAVSGAIGAIALLGLTTKYAVEAHPFWTYDAADAELVQDIQRANHWSILRQTFFARARSQLLSNAARFRFVFSELLLTRGATREALHGLFPDLPLLERIREKLDACCVDVQAFMSAETLTHRAGRDVAACCRARATYDWAGIKSLTDVYVDENSRTDAVDGAMLARLLCARTEALIRLNAFHETRHTVEVFEKTFPTLILPLVYGVAVDVLLAFLASRALDEATVDRARRCTIEIMNQRVDREVPYLVEIWYLSVIASFGQVEARPATEILLQDALTFFLQQQMKNKPSHQRIVQEKVTVVKEILSTGASEEDERLREQEIKQAYMEQCDVYINGVVNSVHLLLEALPPEHVAMGTLGPRLLKHVLGTVKRSFAAEPEPLPSDAFGNFLALLCPVDGGNAAELSEEWVRQLGAFIVAMPREPE